jgi:hypothetical protein
MILITNCYAFILYVSDSGLQCNKHNSYWYRVQYQDRQTALGLWYGRISLVYPTIVCISLVYPTIVCISLVYPTIVFISLVYPIIVCISVVYPTIVCKTIVGYTRLIQTIVGYTRLIQTNVFCSVINFYNCKFNIFWFRVNGLKVL